MHTTIKIHLDPEEFAPIDRLARELQVSPEAVAYSGLNTLMLHAREADIRRQIVNLQTGRREGLPAWADAARSVHIYESQKDD